MPSFRGPGVTQPGEVRHVGGVEHPSCHPHLGEAAGSADFSGAAYDASAFTALDGVVGFAGRSFDLSSVDFDLSADTDGDASSTATTCSPS